MKSNSIIVFFIISLSLNLNAQYFDGDRQYSAQKNYQLAESARKSQDYYSAAFYYKQYLAQKPKRMNAVYKLADCYRLSRNYVESAKTYKHYIDSARKVSSEAYFYFADMLMQQGKYDSALTMFTRAKKMRLQGLEKNLVRRRMEGCEMAMQSSEESRRTRIVHLDETINKANTELSPMFLTGNKMVYSSVHTNEFEYVKGRAKDANKELAKFYMAKRTSDTTFSGASLWDFNDELLHTGNGVFSADKNRFYFTRCSRDILGRVRCKIYVSTKEDGIWGEQETLNDQINLRGYTSTQLTMGRESRYNREVLYFVSDRPGGRGGTDIWYTIFYHENGRYSSPKNCGSRVNTKANEMTPFFNVKGGELYFSSDYYPGYGGMDIFKCRGEQRKWSKPQNLGGYINSPADELYFTLNPEKSIEGFFVSNRVGSNYTLHETCCDDIFFFQTEEFDRIYISGIIRKDPELENTEDIINQIIETSKDNNIIIDESIKTRLDKMKNKEVELDNLLDETVISVYLLEEDEEGEEEIYLYSDTTDGSGRYTFELEPMNNYKIVFKKDLFFNQNLKISTKNTGWNDTIVLHDIKLKPVPRDPVTFNVYYEIDSYKLKPESKEKIDTTLLTMLQESPDLIVELSSHTDSTASHAYNQELSQNRAQGVVNYLVEKGIDVSRLIAVGYGEDRPIASNGTEEGRAKNRRTEFRVVGSLDQFSKLNVTEIKVTKVTKEGEKIRTFETERDE